MSHGPTSEGSSAEPNLTPLLDVVLQLIMFFMMCVNFVSAQTNETIQLPSSFSVRPMDKDDVDVLYLNFKPYSAADFQDRLPADVFAKVQETFHEGDQCILVFGKEPMRPQDLSVWLKQKYDDAKRQAEERTDGGPKEVNTAIIIRAHKDADYAQVFQILQLCKDVGYRRLKLRAMSKNAGGGS